MHLLITEWANKVYTDGLLPDRRTEVIALLIGDSIPQIITEPDNIIIRAIYYARVSNETKQKLLMEKFALDNLDALWDIALRLKYENVVELMIAKIMELTKND